jgi:hypothetical protein
MTEHIRDDRTPDKDEQRQALPDRIFRALAVERFRGERHEDETPTGDLVDAVLLLFDEYADGLHDDLSDDNERLRGDLAKADTACIEARAGSHRLRETLKKFVAASLEYDYTVDSDCGRDYDTDAEEQAASLANVAEMHRLLGVRVQRLDAAYDENERLRAKLAVYEAIPDLCTCKARRGVVHVRGARAAAACEHAETAAAQPSTVAEQLRYQASHSEHGSQFHAENERRLRAELATAVRQRASLARRLGIRFENEQRLSAELATAREERDEARGWAKHGFERSDKGVAPRWLLDSYGPILAEAGDSTADETSGARWLSDREYEVGNEAAPSAETVEPVSTTLQRVINDLHSEAGFLNPQDIANPEDISRKDKVKAYTLIEYADRLRKHPALARPASSVRDTAETPNAPSEVAPSCCGTTSDCTETQCFCEPDTCGHVGETPGGAA